MLSALEGLTGLIQFASITYLLLLSVAVATYFVLPGVRTRMAWLLFLSVGFYLVLVPRWFWVLLLVTSFTYLVGLLIGHMRRTDTPRHAALGRVATAAGVLAVVCTLAIFKYLGFMGETGNLLLESAHLPLSLPVVRLLLPIGISFWTFQTIAYMVDVHRGVTEPERNPLHYALAVMFFPIVTAGPITRIQTLVPQLRQRHRFDYDCMQSGLLLIGRGFFKKLMVADALAVFVNTVFDNPYNYFGTQNGLIFAVAAAFFAVQLYCDFSGYTDVVRGSALLFGVELPINFRAPYFSRSVRDFWRRWHITLMDWLRDYVYIPLGGSRKGRLRRNLNVMAVFLVSGIWHGAGLNFIVWGGLNGAYMILGELLEPWRERVARLLRVDRASFGHRVFQTLFTFGLLSVAWVFFRAGSVSEAIYIVPRMFVPTLWIFTDGTMVQQGLSYSELLVALVSAAIVWLTDWLSLHRDMLAALRRQPLYFRWAAYYGLILSVAIFGRYGGGYDPADFVYFRF